MYWWKILDRNQNVLMEINVLVENLENVLVENPGQKSNWYKEKMRLFLFSDLSERLKF